MGWEEKGSTNANESRAVIAGEVLPLRQPKSCKAPRLMLSKLAVGRSEIGG